MKKGFTMIELIFVIVILGILAAVAIPKLNATRDDAELAKGLTNFSVLINDLQGYYTAKGDFSATNSDMTNVIVEGTLGSAAGAEFPVKKKKCVKVIANPTTSKIVISKGTEATDSICTSFLDSASFKQFVGNGDLTADYEINLGANGIF